MSGDSNAGPTDDPTAVPGSNGGPVSPIQGSPPPLASTHVPDAAKRRRRVRLIVAGLVALALIAGGVSWALRPKTFTLNGAAQVDGSYAAGKVGEPCSGSGPASNVREGADVTVYDSSDVIVAKGRLGPGVGKRDSRFSIGWACQFSYSFKVPTGSKSYSVKVGDAREAELQR